MKANGNDTEYLGGMVMYKWTWSSPIYQPFINKPFHLHIARNILRNTILLWALPNKSWRYFVTQTMWYLQLYVQWFSWYNLPFVLWFIYGYLLSLGCTHSSTYDYRYALNALTSYAGGFSTFKKRGWPCKPLHLVSIIYQTIHSVK